MSKKVFISYRRADEPLSALLLYSLLIELLPKQNVFLDTEGIKPGETFSDRLLDELSSSDIVLVVIGRGWDGGPTGAFMSRLFDPADIVRQEILYALEAKKTIIPLFVGGAGLNRQYLPAEITPLKQRQGIDIRPDHFKYDARQMIVQTRICSEAELLARQDKNQQLTQYRDGLLARYLQHVADVAKVAVGSGIGTTLALNWSWPFRRRVALYSTPSDSYSNAARDFFYANLIPFTDYDVTRDLKRRNELIERSGQMGYPVITVGDDIVVGFDEPKLRRLLGI